MSVRRKIIKNYPSFYHLSSVLSFIILRLSQKSNMTRCPPVAWKLFVKTHQHWDSFKSTYVIFNNFEPILQNIHSTSKIFWYRCAKQNFMTTNCLDLLGVLSLQLPPSLAASWCLKNRPNKIYIEVFLTFFSRFWAFESNAQ